VLAGVVMHLGQGADLHMAKLMPMQLTIVVVVVVGAAAAVIVFTSIITVAVITAKPS